jgi:hypothetical protein
MAGKPICGQGRRPAGLMEMVCNVKELLGSNAMDCLPRNASSSAANGFAAGERVHSLLNKCV